ncbi:hypothetical protein KDM87_15285 [Undibacterium sp. FT147W]|uniref:Phospholipase D-like domain-containing protein n=1 Tax=Undibacterium rivi TaxID=2828729 RepID=A0ABS5H5Q7_9BURK|nr:hypothetical protein [Undibacterium rivi]MBR7793955.1 hypothetical protein [Undibacterium rivi]
MVEMVTMRNCLESMVKSFDDGNIAHVLLTTFNFDPGFFEKNVLPLICGFSVDDLKTKSLDALSRDMFHPLKKMKVVVAYDQAVMQGASGGGIRYSFLPKHQKNGFFHAKIIVLSGFDAKQNPKATVMVSSGNMTLSGWGSNIEMPAWVEVNQENAQELLGFYRYLNHTELQSGIDILQRISGKEDSPKLFLQYPSKNRGTLFERMFEPRLSGDIQIYSPYWSEDAINTFRSKVKVHCYPALGNLGYNFPVPPEKLEGSTIQVCAIKGEESFRHAKAYFWANYMAIGSANCTMQALHSKNNIEAMLLFEDYPQPQVLSEPLKNWNIEPEYEEGIKPAPLDVLIIADYEKRSYQVSLHIHNKSRCKSWQLQLAGIRLNQVIDFEDEIPFEKDAAVARVFRVMWEDTEESQFMTGMIIPCNGNDVELGYRPKRHLDKIFEDMLRHKISNGGDAPRGSDMSDVDDQLDYEVDADDIDLMQTYEEYEFDMYGMYQSFYHLKKSFCRSDSSKIPGWKYEELSDTLQEILLAIKDGEVKNRVQQWLMFQEVMDLARNLPKTQLRKFELFRALQKSLDQDLRKILQNDKTMQDYEITPENLLSWINKELGYECK